MLLDVLHDQHVAEETAVGSARYVAEPLLGELVGGKAAGAAVFVDEDLERLEGGDQLDVAADLALSVM